MGNYTQQNFLNSGGPGTARAGLIPVTSCPRTWFVESLLVSLFCFFPFGLTAMWYASKVERAHALGNYEAAEANSQKAKKLVKLSAYIGLAIWIIGLVLYLSGTVDSGPLLTYSV